MAGIGNSVTSPESRPGRANIDVMRHNLARQEASLPGLRRGRLMNCCGRLADVKYDDTLVWG